ncbi:endonuclease [Streptomyces sp. PTM05]|uniref:Endonuclease n=1 Tax=Streptantibioticus parmotrematis TaxID=2873249 RepID=A0ABS7QX78_9ACTN|nr:endonuclease/exonuclease/phosphatase family protein [Streptantibioticus parmotrematis]MBY8887284.1 endonuclease [Streptantibioticus parmotrematis]
MTAGQLSLTAVEAVRLMLFNAQHASPDRSRRQAEWIAAQEIADIAVLTEVSSTGGGDALTTALADRGYATVIAPQPPTRDYRTVIACRTPNAQPVPSPVTVTPHRAPAARITLGDHHVGVLGLYVPSRGPRQHRNVAKRAFQNAVTKALPQLHALFPAMPVIVAGDLNVIEPGHQPPHKVFGTWEYDFYNAFPASGFTDAFRHLHPEQTAHSWYGRSGNGFRFDHIHLTRTHAAQITACDYHHEPRENGLSDHAAMTLQLRLSGPSTRASPPPEG